MERSAFKVAVITFPGSNCDDDCAYVLNKTCGFSVDRLWHKETPSLSHFQMVVLPGGFSYGDYLRCGAIASLSPIMDSVRNYANTGGMVLGICNGFQMLCEMGLLPGALVRNESGNFICKDVTLRVEVVSPWTYKLKVGDLLDLPIAHGEGRYVVSSKEYEKMCSHNQIILRYVNADGEDSKISNPNGSQHSIAGICNEQGNIFGLMPHPERATDLGSMDGMKMWMSLLSTIEERTQ